MARSRKAAERAPAVDVPRRGGAARVLLLPARPFIALARKLYRLVRKVVRLLFIGAILTAIVTLLDALFSPSGKDRDRGA
ncbi:MAG: hypothetical protein IT302_00045 [Dehalococcoidia bacterium]|nr:hypothetical protein [Dehalococcoidia bacterium]